MGTSPSRDRDEKSPKRKKEKKDDKDPARDASASSGNPANLVEWYEQQEKTAKSKSPARGPPPKEPVYAKTTAAQSRRLEAEPDRAPQLRERDKGKEALSVNPAVFPDESALREKKENKEKKAKKETGDASRSPPASPRPGS